MEAEAVVYC